VELEDVTAGTAAIAVEGPDAGRIRPAAGGHSIAPFSLTGQPGYRIYCSAEEKPGVIGQLEAAPATPEDARAVRIENGMPRYGEDIRETSLVQETQQMHAVSFTKGCYIGQEIVERVRAQGHVNKKLVRVEFEAADAVAPGTKLTAAGAEVGEVTSSIYSPQSGKVIALAVVRTPFADPGTLLDSGAQVL
jgi:folate-binding protein YgfZ